MAGEAFFVDLWICNGSSLICGYVMVLRSFVDM